MRIKELKKTVNLSWSPADHYPVLIAAGTAAQQVDESFSPSSHLELYGLNLGDSSQDLELKSSLQTQHKFHKLVWSGAGVIVGGCDDGLLEFYSADKLLKNAGDALIGTSNKHKGHVSTLDINPYQKNLLASGASESEIFIWDLNNTSQPMAPGNRSQPYDHVQEVAWNQQVQHILGSTFSTRCVVWDLRKNEPIMKLSDPQARSRWSSVAWHPGVATQLCLASADDLAPGIQLWDLRLASSPLKTLDGHSLGVLSLSWCQQDPNILLSAGKDGIVNCYDPNDSTPGAGCVRVWGGAGAGGAGALRAVQGCARAPGLLAASALRSAALHSLLGAAAAPQSMASQSNIMDSFGGALSSLPAVESRAQAPPPPPQPRRAPQWLARRARASFAFGGKLVTFEKCPDAAAPKQVVISQVVTDPSVVEKADELDKMLALTMSQDPAANEALADYCRQRGDAASEQQERYAWFLLRAHFLPNYKDHVLDLLGFKQDEIPSKFKGLSVLAGDAAASDIAGLNRGESGETEPELSTDTSTDLSEAHALIERKLANVDLDADVSNVVIPNGDDNTSMICRALICGNLEEAVELCLEADRTADAMVIASLGSQELLYKVQQYHLQQTAASPVALLSGGVLRGAWPALAQRCAAASWRPAVAALLTHAPPPARASACEILGSRLSAADASAALACYLCAPSAERAAALWARAARTPRAPLALVLRRLAPATQPGGTIESILVQEAMQLSSQGCLAPALRLLQLLQHHDLKDRILAALGTPQQQQQQHQGASQGQQRARTVSSQRRPHAPHNDVTSNYNTVASPHETSQWSRPPSAGPVGSPGAAGPPGITAGGLNSRSKYKVDPSVQAAPSYNQYNYSNAPPQPFGYGGPVPDQYSNASVANFGYMNQVNQNPLHQTPLNPMNLTNSNPMAPLNPINPINPVGVMNPTINPLNPAVNGNMPPPAAARPAAPPAAPGWNDPPMLSSKPKPKQELQAQAPITHPLFGVEPPQHVPLSGTYPGQGQQLPGQGQQFPGQGQQFPGQNQQFPGQGQQFPGQGQQFPGQGQQLPGQAQGQQYPGQYPGQFDQQYQGQFQTMQPAKCASPAPAERAAPAQKPGVPGEHAALPAALDALRERCAGAASSPQMKRKLEDVQRRLEGLYDMLREYRLSESALSALHACAQAAAKADYDAALELASALASTSDFASVASFLPGLKVLFQIAKQLQVYVR